jgi:iron complex transport system ATP-binding protein
MLEVQGLSVSYDSHKILNDISFGVKPEQWLMVVGPNGAGKSTIVKAISQGIPYTGNIYFEGKDLLKQKPALLAKKVGILTQNQTVGYSFSVEEVVRLGRYAYTSGIFQTPSEDDEKQITHALEITGMIPLRNQSLLKLSGGELQRTFLAQIFAQNPKLLILDEPTNHLDLIYQKQILDLIKEWAKGTGRAVISVLHDLNLVKAYGTHALLIDRGTKVSFGGIDDVLTPEYLQNVYSMDVYQWMRDLLAQWTQ